MILSCFTAIRLCGGRTPQPVTFIVVATPEHNPGGPELRSIDVFAEPTQPVAQGSPQSCGTYNYEAGGPTPLPTTPLGKHGNNRTKCSK